MSGSWLFFPHPSAELQHQLAKNKHHSSTIYVHRPRAGEEESRQVSPSPGCSCTHMWPLLTMHITQLNRECLLHLFSFLDKDSRKSLARTCSQLHDVFEDPALWSLLHFRSLTELQKDNFLLGPALRSLSICWHSSRVQVCSIEDWLKSAFQRSICSRHERLVNDFLLQVCDRLSAVPSARRREAPAPFSGTPIAVESKSPRWRGPEHSEFAGLRAGVTGARAAAGQGCRAQGSGEPPGGATPREPAGSRSALGTAVSKAPGSDLGKAGGGEAGAQGQKEPPSRSSLRFCPHARLPAHLSWG
ncbi:F-box and leucine-rich protein 22 isoform X1 [Rhinopithecus roxellana]|uniref:F-box and leucine-rich protein 22 isoform X1 n=1 Tax=Rhinopithecus roxellana TaxID=61622 RepID=UPI0012377EA8|nr:F-box and leucine-rich protein 22 isoform X1 [Rhinopithecus roxellana]